MEKSKIKFICLLALLASVFSTLHLYADEPDNLATLIDEAVRNNPEIIASKNRYEAAKNKIPQASSLNNPEFEFKYDKINASMDAVMEGDTAPMRTYAVSQDVPFLSKLLTRAQIAQKEAQIAYSEYREKERRIISSVKSLYSELAFVYKSIDITKENKLLLEQLASSASAQYSLGKTSQQDALKAHVEIARMDNELLMLEQKRQAKQARLDILLNKDPSFELGPIASSGETELKYTLDELNKITLEKRPELMASHLAVERAKKIYSLAKQEYLPDFTVKYESMERDGRLTDWAGMVGISIPLWFWQKESFNVSQMKNELKAMEAEYQDKKNTVLLEVKDAYSKAEAYKKLATLYKTSFIPQAEQAFKSASVGYEANTIDFLNLLDSQRTLLEFKLDYYMATVEHEAALAELEMAVGIDL
ncbi:MAG: TolC family protein [Candidatus Omnitrophota bacterium]